MLPAADWARSSSADGAGSRNCSSTCELFTLVRLPLASSTWCEASVLASTVPALKAPSSSNSRCVFKAFP